MSTTDITGTGTTETTEATATEATSTDADGIDANAPSRITVGDLARRGLTVGAVVLLSLAVVRGVAGALVPLGGVQPTAWPAVLGTGVVVTVGATVVYALLTRLLARPDRAFVGLAVVVLALSMVPLAFVAPTLPGVTTAVIGVLGVMHVVAAVGSVVVLTGRWL